MLLMSVRTLVVMLPPDYSSVISAGAEAGGPSFQTQHLRGIWTGQL